MAFFSLTLLMLMVKQATTTGSIMQASEQEALTRDVTRPTIIFLEGEIVFLENTSFATCGLCTYRPSFRLHGAVMGRPIGGCCLLYDQFAPVKYVTRRIEGEDSNT